MGLVCGRCKKLAFTRSEGSIAGERPARLGYVSVEALRVLLQLNDRPEDTVSMRGFFSAYAVQIQAEVGPDPLVTFREKVAKAPRIRGEILRKRLRRAAASMHVPLATLGRLRHVVRFLVVRLRESRSHQIPRRR